MKPERRLAGRLTGVLALSVALTVGCATTSGRGSTHDSTIRVFAEDANGRDALTQAVSAHPGDTIEVDLESLYWQLVSVPDRRVLRVEKQTTTHAVLLPSGERPCSASVPGTGCGTQTFDFRAVSAGDSVLRASRTSCGEALRCGVSQASFVLAVHVRG